MNEQQNYTFPHHGFISCHDREELLGQKGVVLWLTGLSGSGKSTIAHALEKRLFETGRLSFVLDGDNIRNGLNRDLGFQPGERRENIRRIAEVASLFADCGIIAIVAFISPYKRDRSMAKDIIGIETFYEIHVTAPLSICEKRDPKQLYQKARKGEIINFTGIDDVYEIPEKSILTLDTVINDVSFCVEKVYRLLINNGIISENT